MEGGEGRGQREECEVEKGVGVRGQRKREKGKEGKKGGRREGIRWGSRIRRRHG